MKIPMRKVWISALLCLALAACGGNYSNEDLEFLNALPQKTELASNLTGADGGTPAMLGPDGQPMLLGEQPKLLVRQTSNALAVGDPSSFALSTRGASDGFNQFLFAALDLLEAVTRLPPTERAPDQRTWGPYPDDKHPGWQAKLVMTRTGSEFDYEVDTQLVGATDWLTILSGRFKASSGLRKGEGDLHLFVARSQAAGFSMNADPKVDTIDATYRTDQPPTTVTLTVSQVGTPDPVFAYGYAGAADGSGEMGFVIVDTTNQSTLKALGRWTPDGSGRGDAVVTSGSQVGATWTECWDPNDAVLFSAQSWAPPAVGDLAQCAFGPPPP